MNTLAPPDTSLNRKQAAKLDRLPPDVRVVRWSDEHHGPVVLFPSGERAAIGPTGYERKYG